MGDSIDMTSGPVTTPAPTRAAGLERLRAWIPDAGSRYAARRNHDLGPDDRGGTSLLSPYLRHRLVTEEEVLAAVLGRHGPDAAFKFVQEIFWRVYWKGWLERRPGVWADYLAAVTRLAAEWDGRDEARARLAAAAEGRTGIDCFDAWAHELVGHGYLHNHARMWFASIWIFTLRLPWQLGADLFMRHLLDGDPASNTLSWRWVAGLHTKGKHYLATRENIRTYTDGRFDPRGLDESAAALAPGPDPDVRPLPPAAAAVPAGDHTLILHEDDCAPETLPRAGGARIVSVRGTACHRLRSPFPVSPAVRTFTEGALRDALGRASREFGCPEGEIADGAPDASGGKGPDGAGFVTPYAPVGPAASALAGLGGEVVAVRRALDSAAWPYAERGYFRFRKALPGLIGGLPGNR